MSHPWPTKKVEEFVALWPDNSSEALAKHFGTSRGAIMRRARNMGLERNLPQKRRNHELAPSHPAMSRMQPKYPNSMVTAHTSPAVFLRGKENRKIGNKVAKGRWKGMPLYTLTLAERTTCPSTCPMLAKCYGNNLHFPKRHVLDHSLIERMGWELTGLAARHPDGFVVRLHVLGDFGSDSDQQMATKYAAAWLNWLSKFEALRVFGFTAWHPDTIIGSLVSSMNARHADRCRIRFSGEERGGEGALVIADREESRHIVCPWDSGKVNDCGSCGLCWTMDHTVEFVEH